jgi:hypothetical protein
MSLKDTGTIPFRKDIFYTCSAVPFFSRTRASCKLQLLRLGRVVDVRARLLADENYENEAENTERFTIRE